MKRMSPIFTRALAGWVVALLLAACGGNAATPAQTTAGLEKPMLTVGFGPFAGNDVANRLPDFAKKHGLTVQTTIIRAGADLLTALYTGQIDSALLTYTYLYQSLDRGTPVVALASNVKGGTTILMSKKLGIAAGDYPGLKALVASRAASGKKLVFASNKPSINYAVGYLDLTSHGIDMHQLDYKDSIDLTVLPQMVASGQADLSFMGEPQGTLAERLNLGSAFATPAKAVNTEFLALKTFADKYPRTAKALVASIFDASAYLKSHLDETARDVAHFSGVAEDVATDALKRYTLDSRLDLPAAKELAGLLYREGLVKTDYSDKIKEYLLTNLQPS